MSMNKNVSLIINIHPHLYARIRYWLTTWGKPYKVKPLLLTLWILSFSLFQLHNSKYIQLTTFS